MGEIIVSVIPHIVQILLLVGIIGLFYLVFKGAFSKLFVTRTKFEEVESQVNSLSKELASIKEQMKN